MIALTTIGPVSAINCRTAAAGAAYGGGPEVCSTVARELEVFLRGQAT